MKLVFATNNPHKLTEVKALLPDEIELLSLKDIGCTEEIVEDRDTIEGNARLKADYITDHYGFDCFADDTGLEVAALNGAPGVYSARYAGENPTYEDNVDKLLAELEHKTDRNAQFRTVIALNLQGKHYFFEGICKGTIIKEKKGADGFGYDPVFKPDGFNKTFAEMSIAEKGEISHRGKAVRALVKFLSEFQM